VVGMGASFPFDGTAQGARAGRGAVSDGDASNDGLQGIGVQAAPGLATRAAD
jgi:hypothetical protein